MSTIFPARSSGSRWHDWRLPALFLMAVFVLLPARLETRSRLSFATYLGSDLADRIVALETDAAGNVHVFGTVPNAPTFLSFPPTNFVGPGSVFGAANSCYVAKFVPDGAGRMTQSYLAIVYDSTNCDAMAVSPSGEVFIARTSDEPGTLIESFSDASGSVERTRQFTLPQLGMTLRMRVDAASNVYAIGVCAKENFDGELWPLPGGFQPGPAGANPPCKDPSASAPRTTGQHVLIAARETGHVFYGSFFGFDTSQIDPTALEIDPNGLAYIAGHTKVGRGPTILTTPNAIMLQPGDASCPLNAPGCEPGDGFLIVADPNAAGPSPGASLRFGSYVGGTGREHAIAMALADNGLVHLAGNTQSRHTFPGFTFDDVSAVFDLVLDVRQPAGSQFIRSAIIASGGGTRLLPPNESHTRLRLLPGGLSALIVRTDDLNFPLVDPLYYQPRDPNASGDVNPLLLVHDAARDAIVFATYLDDVNMAHGAHVASAPDGTLYAALLTHEQGRATDGSSPLGGDDVLLLAITGIGPANNTPPVAEAGPDQTILGDSPAASLTTLYGGFSFDPDDDPLTYRWSEGTTELGVGASVQVLLSQGDHTITLTVDDGRGGTGSDTVMVRVLPNTSAGGPLSVTPPDRSWVNFGHYNQFPVTVRFADVTSTGFTSVASRYELSPMPPAGMQFGSPPLLYDVATSAGFSGAVDVCVSYRGMSFATPDSGLRMYHRVNGTWVPLPQVNDTSSRNICGTAATLGTFALFTPAVPANEISILAGRPVRTTPCDLVWGPDPNDGGLATDSFLCNARGLAYDAPRNYLYFAEAAGADKIRRLDLSTRLLTTVGGTGFPIGGIDGPGGDTRDDDRNNVDPRTAPLSLVLAVAIDPAGNLYVAEFGEGRIRKIDFSQNRIVTVKTLGEPLQPSTMVLDTSGALLFATFTGAGGNRIWRLTPGADGTVDGSPDELLAPVAGNGGESFQGDLVPPTGALPLQIPISATGIALGPDGSLYVTGYLGQAYVLRITPGADGLIDGVSDTAFLVGAGRGLTPDAMLGDGDAATNARLFSPGSVAVAPNGDVYVGDTGHYQAATVRRITAVDGEVTGAPDEIITTIAGFHVFDSQISTGTELPYSDGDGHALSAIFGAAFDLLVMPDGSVLVNDFYQIRRIGPRGGADSTAPVLTLPGRLVAEAETSSGAVVTFVATAADDVDGAVAVTCSPSSGSVFAFAAPGPTSTSVVCSATDAAGNAATEAFEIVVQDTTPPSVTGPPPITIAATEATGVRGNVPQAPDTVRLLDLLAGGTATDLTDPAPVRLPTQRLSCADPSLPLDTVSGDSVFPLGRNCVRLPFHDRSGNLGYAVATFDVLPPIGGHVNGAGVAVVATAATNVAQPVTATFLALQQPGLLTTTSHAPSVPAPSGFSITSPAFDVRSTALPFPGAASVCITVTGVQAGDRIFRLEGTTWTDLTTSVDVATSRVCGLPAPLGIFATGRLLVVRVDVIEQIGVSDAPGVLPSAMVGVIEQIAVVDGPIVQPAVLVGVFEQIAVVDGPGVVPQGSQTLTMTLTPAQAQAGVGDAVTWTATVSDESDEETRVVLRATTRDPRVQFVRPAVANAPLSVSVTGVNISVSLATDASGAVSSTAADVVAAIDAHPASSALVSAATWLGRAGTGIVPPQPLTALSTIYLSVGNAPALACFTSVPGSCSQSHGLSQPGTAAVVAFLDLDGNGSQDASEPAATAEATWVDRTPPALTLPESITALATSDAGAAVSFDVSAVDVVDGAVTPACTPASGATFPMGTTTVLCSAVDQAGNTAGGSFNVIVGATTAAFLQVTSTPVFTPNGDGQFIASLTVGNDGLTIAGDVAITTADLNGKSAVALPVHFGDIMPGDRVTRQVTFPPSADPSNSARKKAINANLKLTFSWRGGSSKTKHKVLLPPAKAPLWGWADLHTHPMSNLAFGGKLFHGAPDVGSLMPAIQMPYDPQCRFDVRALTMDEALSDDAPTHGDAVQSRCGNFLRNALVQALEGFNHAVRQPGHAVGAPTFVNWPKWNDITHQKMWVDWIRRAKDGGLRVMVALSHNNRTLAELMGAGGPISGVRKDQGSSDLQIDEIKAFVARHPGIMKVALTATDLHQIVQDGKIAVILGVEVDNIGNFNEAATLSPAIVEAEIDRLYAQGVRYVFPVHLTDNVFGDTAIYDALFNVANRRETGDFWTVGCAAPGDRVGFRSFNFPPELNLFLAPGVPQPPRAQDCTSNNGTFLGHVNARTPNGITALGEYAIKTMMKRGMIVDVDHLSDRGVEAALRLAEAVPFGGYPLVSGHSAIRDGVRFKAENSRTRTQLQRIGCLQGMFGLGGDGAAAYQWASEYMDAFTEMGRPTPVCPNKSSLGSGRVAFGTDTNSLVSGPRPSLVDIKTGMAPRYTDIYNPANAANDNPLLPVLPRSTTGLKTWDYNLDGVAHYGMYADFVKDLRTAPASVSLPITGKNLVDNHLLRSADYFFRMWERIEAQRANVR